MQRKNFRNLIPRLEENQKNYCIKGKNWNIRAPGIRAEIFSSSISLFVFLFFSIGSRPVVLSQLVTYGIDFPPVLSAISKYNGFTT